MNTRVLLLALLFCLGGKTAVGQGNEATAPRRISLHEAVELALQHNHVIRIAKSTVDEKQAAKDVARSAYFPVVRNDSVFVHVTDTQFIEIPAGALGVIGGNPLPARPLVLNQGGHTFETSGTGLVQPLSQLWKIKAGNDVTRAELNATRGKARGIENQIVLTVHQLYYKILVAEVRHSAVQAKIDASDELQSERVQQVKYGSALDADLIESRAQRFRQNRNC